MSMINWAEREVQIACKREAPNKKDYGCDCYESALKAYKSLCEDGHSGLSFNLTKQILIRLMNRNPLTPIEDVPDVWNESYISHDGSTAYQCVRKYSLFKHIYPDGTVKYSDNDRLYCMDIDHPNSGYSSGFIRDIVDELYPITMPYCPDDKPMKVMCETFLVNPKNGDFDTRAILHIIMPNGSIKNINRYFCEKENGWVEIEKSEYDKRKEIKNAKN